MWPASIASKSQQGYGHEDPQGFIWQPLDMGSLLLNGFELIAVKQLHLIVMNTYEVVKIIGTDNFQKVVKSKKITKNASRFPKDKCLMLTVLLHKNAMDIKVIIAGKKEQRWRRQIQSQR
jgi:hypothetical protein